MKILKVKINKSDKNSQKWYYDAKKHNLLNKTLTVREYDETELNNESLYLLNHYQLVSCNSYSIAKDDCTIIN